MTVSPTATRFPSSTSACGRARVSSLRRTAPPTRSRPPAAKTRPTPAVHTGAWSGTPIRDTGCCCHPLTGVPCLRPGPRGTEEMMQPCPPNLKCHLFGGTLEQLLHRQPDAAVRVRALLLHLHLQDRPGPVGRLPRRHPRDAVGKHRPGAPGRNRHAPAGRGLHRLRHQHRLGATQPPIVPLPVHCLVLVLSLPFHCPQVDADDVVLGFLKPPGAGVGGTPLQTLFGFERVHVKVRVHDPGGVTVSDSIALTHPDRPARRWRSTSEPP